MRAICKWQAELQGLVIGSGDAAVDAEALSTPSGAGCLVVGSLLLDLKPGFCKVQLPEAKHTKK